MRKFGNLLLDIVNGCNVRCPFCVTDWTAVSKTVFMDDDIFSTVLELLEISNGYFFFSCLYEPTVHPKMNSYLKQIPIQYQLKTFFTTNLTKPMSDQTFQEWADLKLNHVAISLDSFDPDLFEDCRRGARYTNFESNLDRLSSIFQRQRSPDIRFITIVTKRNINQVPEMIKIGREKYGAKSHQLRHYFPTGNASQDWIDQNVMNHSDWDNLLNNLDKSQYVLLDEFLPVTDHDKQIKMNSRTKVTLYTENITDIISPLLNPKQDLIIKSDGRLQTGDMSFPLKDSVKILKELSKI